MTPEHIGPRELSLALLRALVALGEDPHFGRAAVALGVSQSTLSRRIKDLERIVGQPLVERTTRRTELTPVGARLAEESATGVRRIDAAVRRARRGTEGETVRIGVTWTGFSTLPTLAGAALAASSRHITVRFVSGPTERLLELLRAGELDVAFARTPCDVTGLDSLDSQETEAIVAVLPAGHPLAEHSTVNAADLATGPMLLWDRAQAPQVWDRIVTHVFGRAEPCIGLSVPTERDMLAAVPLLGLPGLVTESTALRQASTDLAVRPLEPPLHLGLSLVWPSDYRNGPVLDVLRRLVEKGRAPIGGAG